MRGGQFASNPPKGRKTKQNKRKLTLRLERCVIFFCLCVGEKIRDDYVDDDDDVTTDNQNKQQQHNTTGLKVGERK